MRTCMVLRWGPHSPTLPIMKSNSLHNFLILNRKWESVVDNHAHLQQPTGFWLGGFSGQLFGLHSAQVAVSVTRLRQERHTWVASRSMNSIITHMLPVSCTNLKPTVVKIGLLVGRWLCLREPPGLILQLFPWLKTNASFITAVTETWIP